MTTKSALQEYRKKRDLKKSPEPKGGLQKKSKEPIFVIQKHDASHLHYDFRIEIDGVLASWAVPKGPSTDPAEKRLAVPTEDHPLEYANFEGVIPEGYGAGTVMIWDRGTYENIKMEHGKLVPMKHCYKEGRIEIFLFGQKLEGAYALIRTAKKYGGKTSWLLVKMRDEYADARRNPVNTQNKSVISDRTMTQIRRESEKGKK